MASNDVILARLDGLEAGLSSSLADLSKVVGGLVETINGNGQPGLKTRLAVLEQQEQMTASTVAARVEEAKQLVAARRRTTLQVWLFLGATLVNIGVAVFSVSN